MSQQYFEMHLKFLRENYPLMPRSELAVAFNAKFNTDKTAGQLASVCKRLKIKSGRTGRWEKGHKPWSAGTKGLLKGSSTSFKKCSIPYNVLPIGTERIDEDGYILIKTGKPSPYNEQRTRFRHKHLEVWEAANKMKIPKGMAVSFLDGNKLNCEPGNLELVSKAEILYRNQHGYKSLNDELKPTMRVLAKLETQRFKKEKKASR